jgi:D-glutamate N-acetyltransferase
VNASQARLVILAEGQFGEVGSKTAIGVIRYGPQKTVAVLDTTHAGRNVRDWLGAGYDIPVVATLRKALAGRPTALLIGIAPAGGKLPAAWRATILEALHAGLDVLSGLHVFLGDDPEFAAVARERGVTITDYRRPPERMEVARGREHDPGKKVILTVGTDCALGKMTVALELRRAAVQAGLSTAFVATGQTGMMIEGWGVAVDRVASDFVQGTTEWLVERAETMGDWVFVEGQGSLDHAAYSCVTLGLIHGATPHAMIMVHEPGREYHHGWEGSPQHRLKELPAYIALHEQVAALVAPSVVAGVALSTLAMTESAARREIARVEDETGLTTDDPLRFGAERLLDALGARLP